MRQRSVGRLSAFGEPSVWPCVCPSVDMSMYPCIHSSIRPGVHVFVYSFVHVSMCPCVHVSVYPFIHWSIHPFIHSSMCPHLHMSIHPFACVHASIHPCNHILLCPAHLHFSIQVYTLVSSRRTTNRRTVPMISPSPPPPPPPPLSYFSLHTYIYSSTHQVDYSTPSLVSSQTINSSPLPLSTSPSLFHYPPTDSLHCTYKVI